MLPDETEQDGGKPGSGLVTPNGDVCPYCNNKMDINTVTREHITPWDTLKQGLPTRLDEINACHDWDNLVNTCSACNSAKQAQSLLVYLLRILARG
jgi:5-methylcytosine-specific restriction endonuclease McrA